MYKAPLGFFLILLLSAHTLLAQSEIPDKVEEKSESGQSTLITTGSSILSPQTPSLKLPAYMETDSMAATQVKWTEEHFDFGEIVQGEKVTHTFSFKNTGEHPLKLTQVKPSCGCTAPNWSRELIPPGKEGFVEVTFDSSGKSGTQNKSITVFLNTPEKAKTLRFKGFITERN